MSRNYSPEREEFRRVHARHRDWGLAQRHGLKLWRLRRERAEAAAAAQANAGRPARPTDEQAPQPTSRPAAEQAPVPTSQIADEQAPQPMPTVQAARTADEQPAGSVRAEQAEQPEAPDAGAPTARRARAKQAECSAKEQPPAQPVVRSEDKPGGTPTTTTPSIGGRIRHAGRHATHFVFHHPLTVRTILGAREDQYRTARISGGIHPELRMAAGGQGGDRGR